MKTKYLFFALSMPLAFAACQNEEFLTEETQLANRGKINLTLSAEYPTVEADTRMSASESGNALSFVWEKGTDKLGAALMDNTPGTVSNNGLYANYPFIAQNDGASAEFATPSAVTSGIYLFYNSYVDVLNRKPLWIELGEQVYDPASTKTPAQQMADYMNMVAPLVNLNSGIALDKAAEFTLPLEFVNLYTPVKVPVVFKNAKEGTKLNSISITTGEDGFKLGGIVKADVLAGTGNANVLQLKKGAIDDEVLTMADAKKVVDEKVQAGIYSTTENQYTEGAAVLSIKNGLEMKNGEQKDFWILIPRGEYASLIVSAKTSDGDLKDVTIDIPASIDGYPNAYPRKFTSATRSLKAIEIDFNENVAQPSEFKINSSADWTAAIAYVKAHSDYYMGNEINFQIGADKKVYVTSVPSFGYNLSGANGKSQLIFGNSNGSAATMNVDLNGMTAGENVNLVVGAGASVTLTKNVKGGTPAWTNNGAMTVSVAEVSGTIKNNGALYLAKANTNDEKYSVTNNAGGTVTVKGGNGVYVDALVNSAEGEEEELSEGVVRVEAEAVLNVTTLTNNGTIENRGTFAPAASTANAGTIDNYGVLKLTTAFTNNNGGTIVARDGSESNGGTDVITNNGTIEVINPTTWGTLQQNAAKKYSINADGTGEITAAVTNHKDFAAAKTAEMAITLAGGDWTVVGGEVTPGDASRDLNDDDVEFTGNKVTLRSNLNVKADLENENLDVTTKGTSVITVEEGVTMSVKSLTVDGTAELAAGSVLNANTIEVNGTLTNNGVAYAAVNETVSAVAGIKEMTVTVNRNATLTNKGRLGATNSGAKVTVNGNMDNKKGAIWYTYGATSANLPIVGGSQSWTAGTADKLIPVKTSAINLANDFANYKEFVCTGAVTTLHNGDNQEAVSGYKYEFVEGTPAVEFESGKNYGSLSFKTTGSIKGTTSAPTLKSLSVSGAGVVLTVVADEGTDITCLSFSGTKDNVVEGAKKLKKENGTIWINRE